MFFSTINNKLKQANSIQKDPERTKCDFETKIKGSKLFFKKI